MLRHLRVTNFAILSDVSVDPGGGLNVLTGETGAGKSLIVDAVNLLRGGRASADIPRAGATEAVVEAVFEVPDYLRQRITTRLADAGLPDDGAELLVRRVIHRGGRSRVYINGALTTASRLAEIGELLVDLAGQHQHQGLVDPKRHRAIVDEWMHKPECLAEMERAWQALRTIEQAIDELSGAEGVAERIDFLRFQLDEIEAAALEPGEDEELERQRKRLGSLERLESGSQSAREHLYDGDGAAIERIDAALAELDRLSSLDDRLGDCVRQLSEARALVEDVANQIAAYAARLDGDPQQLAEIEERLAAIARLRRKHGADVDAILARGQALRQELDDLERAEERLDELHSERDRAEKHARQIAEVLSTHRRTAAGNLEREAGAVLGNLGMGSARLEVAIEPCELGPRGSDRVELMLGANRGEAIKPLSKVASGGELSRIMLALKLVLRQADPVATYVFDEVDAGIGGETAEVVGDTIRAVAAHRQVLCVTHLPQIAALADRHFRVHKEEIDGRTETGVEQLSSAAQRDEIARMVGGRRVSKSAKAHAEAMLSRAKKDKSKPAART